MRNLRKMLSTVQVIAWQYLTFNVHSVTLIEEGFRAFTLYGHAMAYEKNVKICQLYL